MENHNLTEMEDWNNQLNKVKLYIDTNNRRPSPISNNTEIKTIGEWIHTQQGNYKNNEYNMKDPEIKQLWEKFINDDKYNKYFLSDIENWINQLNKVKLYINTNNQIPSNHSNDTEIETLGKWIKTQQINYKKNKQIMSNPEIKQLWKNFINDAGYKDHFLSYVENWNNQLDKVKNYIDTNNQRPSNHSNDTEIKTLGKWIRNQQINYTNNIKNMKNYEIRKVWENVINDVGYKTFFE